MRHRGRRLVLGDFGCFVGFVSEEGSFKIICGIFGLESWCCTGVGIGRLKASSFRRRSMSDGGRVQKDRVGKVKERQ